MLIDSIFSKCNNYALICCRENANWFEANAVVVYQPRTQIEINLEHWIYVLEPLGDCAKYSGAIVTPDLGQSVVKFRILLKLFNRYWQVTLPTTYAINDTEDSDEKEDTQRYRHGLSDSDNGY